MITILNNISRIKLYPASLAASLTLFLFLFIPPISYPAELLDEIAATVNGQPIMRSELEALMLRIQSDQKRIDNMNPSTFTKKSLNQLIDDKLILNAAEDKNVSPPEDEINQSVENRIERLRQSFNSPDDFNQFLKQRALSLMKLKSELSSILKDNYIIQTAVSRRFSISELDIQNYEDQLQKLGKPINHYHLQHIFLNCPKDANYDDEQAVRNQARDIMIRLQKGEGFDIMASKFSQDTATRNQGGDLGFVDENEILKPIQNALKKLPHDQIAGPIRTDKGFHIIKLLEKRGPEWQLYNKRFNEEKNKWAQQLRNNAVININPKYR